MIVADEVDCHGLPAIRWRSRDGACALATRQGAQLLSWVPPGGEECLYVSERSPFEAGRPVRGGMPVVFPQFADRGPLAQHGFARTLAWRFAGAAETAQGAQACFVLEDSPQTLASWPGAFRLELVATIGGPGLDVQLRLTNTGKDAFDFTAALHTYLRVAEAADASLHGLRGTRFVNRGDSAGGIEDREFVTAAAPIDRVYFAAPGTTRLEDAGRSLRIAQRGFGDTVVWNPGRERTAAMADMAPGGFRRMLCVEAAAIEPPVRLEPGARWDAGQTLTLTHGDPA